MGFCICTFCLLKERRGRVTASCSGLSAHFPTSSHQSCPQACQRRSLPALLYFCFVLEGNSQGSGEAGVHSMACTGQGWGKQPCHSS